MTNHFQSGTDCISAKASKRKKGPQDGAQVELSEYRERDAHVNYSKPRTPGRLIVFLTANTPRRRAKHGYPVRHPG